MAESLAFILSLVLAATFAVAGVAKLRDVAGSRQALEDFGVPARLSRAGGVLLPVAELLVAAALLFAPLAGAIGAIALLAAFVAGIANAMAHDRAPDCHCFGQLHSEPVGRKTLVRNGVLIAMGAAVIALGPGPGLHDWLSDRSAAELVIAALVLGAAALAAQKLFAWSSTRAEELRRARWAAEREAMQLPAGRPIGSDAPDFALLGLDGVEHTLTALCARGFPVALVFVHPECGTCHTLLPTLAAWQDVLAGRLTIAVLSEGSADDNRELRDRHGLDAALLQERSEVYLAYEFRLGTPAAVIVGPDRRIASVAVSGAGAIEELIRLALQQFDATVPPPSVVP